jgi:hypothetical protein
MLSATRGSQFTHRSCSSFVHPTFLKLTSQPFPITTPQSQTQGGTRYIPHLTRFWASLAPLELLVAIGNALQVQGVCVERVADEPGGILLPAVERVLGEMEGGGNRQ